MMGKGREEPAPHTLATTVKRGVCVRSRSLWASPGDLFRSSPTFVEHPGGVRGGASVYGLSSLDVCAVSPFCSTDVAFEPLPLMRQV
eukprot:4951147-Amphidinium_carterae.1